MLKNIIFGIGNLHSKISRKVTILKVKIFNLKYLKLPSNVLKDINEIKTSESSQKVCQYPKFKILDYLPCLCKIPIQNHF